MHTGVLLWAYAKRYAWERKLSVLQNRVFTKLRQIYRMKLFIFILVLEIFWAIYAKFEFFSINRFPPASLTIDTKSLRIAQTGETLVLLKEFMSIHSAVFDNCYCSANAHYRFEEVLIVCGKLYEQQLWASTHRLFKIIWHSHRNFYIDWWYIECIAHIFMAFK